MKLFRNTIIILASLILLSGCVTTNGDLSSSDKEIIRAYDNTGNRVGQARVTKRSDGSTRILIISRTGKRIGSVN